MCLAQLSHRLVSYLCDWKGGKEIHPPIHPPLHPLPSIILLTAFVVLGCSVTLLCTDLVSFMCCSLQTKVTLELIKIWLFFLPHPPFNITTESRNQDPPRAPLKKEKNQEYIFPECITFCNCILHYLKTAYSSVFSTSTWPFFKKPRFTLIKCIYSICVVVSSGRSISCWQ